MSQVPLTRRQREILDYISSYLEEHGISPTLEEIAQHLGVGRVTVFGHVGELERKGVIRKAAPGISRSIRPVEGAIASKARPELTVPVLGRVAAGRPIEAIEDREELDLADLLPRGKDVYALRVRGNL